jgi:hypothetical protein
MLAIISVKILFFIQQALRTTAEDQHQASDNTRVANGYALTVTISSTGERN